MSSFSTDAAVSLEKGVESVINEPISSPQQLDEVYETERCIQWIKSNNFRRVCLQFPDHLLPDSSDVALRLQKSLQQNVYILADTAYGSCCIDYVAAAHINADAVVHFGPVCFSQTLANVPYLNIYEKQDLDLEEFGRCFTHAFKEESPLILLDTCFVHLHDTIQRKLTNVSVLAIDDDALNLENQSVLFIGGRNQHRKLPNLKFSHKPKALYYLNHVEDMRLIHYEQDEKVLRRRYFLVEKIKDSSTVGIVIGTLGVKNYLQAIERIKSLVKLHNKKYYLISVGKPTVAKLANFPEIDVFVIITCALNEIYDSRDYYKPIVTPHDVELALNPLSEDLQFSYDYNDIITRPIGEVSSDHVASVSLVTGKIRGVSNVTVGDELVAKQGGVVAMNSTHGAGFLAARTWKGLERDLGQSEVKLAEKGRHGIAQQYSDETRN